MFFVYVPQTNFIFAEPKALTLAMLAWEYRLPSPSEYLGAQRRSFQQYVQTAIRRRRRGDLRSPDPRPWWHLFFGVGTPIKVYLWAVRVIHHQDYHSCLIPDQSYRPPPFTLDFLLGLLKMSTMWDIPPARAFAISELVEKAKAYTAEFPPFLRFHIGVCFQVEELVLPAFSTLVCRDPWACGTLNVVPHDQLRYELVELVIRTRSLLEAERCRLATIPPPAQMATMCTSHDLCGQLWEHAWVFQIGRLLVHPDRVFRLSFYDGPEKVQELRIPRMNQACLNLTKEVVATGEAFDFETIITRKILLKEGFIQ